MPRRKPGKLLPLEVSILIACTETGEAGSHGFAMAKVIAETGDRRQLTATGTMYRALHRLEAGGLVASWWEDPDVATEKGRPRRRLYRVTGAGAAALVAARTEPAVSAGPSNVDPVFST
jgi:DNA-binding PadR family transcriptional regulator